MDVHLPPFEQDPAIQFGRVFPGGRVGLDNPPPYEPRVPLETALLRRLRNGLATFLQDPFDALVSGTRVQRTLKIAIALIVIVWTRGTIIHGLEGSAIYGPVKYIALALSAVTCGVLLVRLGMSAAWPIADALPNRWLGWVEEDRENEIGVMNNDERIPRFVPNVDVRGEVVGGRGPYIGHLVRLAKLEFGMIQPTIANRLMVRKFLRDSAIAHGLRPTHALVAVERSLALFFVPTNEDVLIRQVENSAPVLERHYRYANVGRNFFQRLWARVVGPRPVPTH